MKLPPGPCQLPLIGNLHQLAEIVNAWALGREPSYRTEADKFHPEWFLNDNTIDYSGTNFKYIRFGAGRRICPGLSFGEPNKELPLAQMLFHFNWQLPKGLKPEDMDMTEAPDLSVKRKDPLLLAPTPHQTLSVK